MLYLTNSNHLINKNGATFSSIKIILSQQQRLLTNHGLNVFTLHFKSLVTLVKTKYSIYR